jgi:two-component system alkaline phosphatase synthesis response regulator PhoP
MTTQRQDYRILVADDEREVVDLVCTILEFEGYRALEAVDGAQAVERARQENPDLILLDVRMPKMTGLSVLDCLAADPVTSRIPVIMLSVVTTYPDIRMALERGAVAYLTKPFEMREMVHLIERVLAADAAGRDHLRQQGLRSIGKR